MALLRIATVAVFFAAIFCALWNGNSAIAGTSPTRWMAVAEAAPILVTTGPPDKPIRLGEMQPWSPENSLHVWDWSKSDQSRPLKATVSGSFAVSPDGKWIITGDGRMINVTDETEKKIDGFPQDVQGLRFSPKGDCVLVQIGSYTGAAGKDGAVARLLDFPSGNPRQSIAGMWAYTFAAAFTPDGKELLIMDKDRVLRRFDAMIGREMARYEPAFDNSIRAITVSRDAQRIAAAGTAGEIYLWDFAPGGRALHKLSAEGAPLPDLTVMNGNGSLAFSPDGSQLAGGAIMAIALWDTGTGRLTRLIAPHKSGSASIVRFSADGKKLTSVREFVVMSGPDGKDQLMYPTVNEWDLQRDGRAVNR